MMKRIVVIQENVERIELFDLDETDIDEYAQKLSSLLELSNASILHTSSASIILRPSKVVSLLVSEIDGEETDTKEIYKKVEDQPKDEDIITDG